MAEAAFGIVVGGDYGCFTRPEFGVERVSYPVMTPSAARGVLEAVFWKPEIRWQIRQVQVLNPLKQTVILRNELSDRQGNRPVFVEDERQQRTSLILKDVKYLIRAVMVLRPHARDPIPKYIDQFERRLQRGQYHHTPCLGMREFPAWFAPATGDEEPAPLDYDIGPMLFEIAYREDPGRPEMEFHRHGPRGTRVVKGYAEALFFHSRVTRGVLDVPAGLYQRLYELEEQDA